MSGPQRIPYTEFQDQFAGENVAEMFARGNTIEGELKKPRRCQDVRTRRSKVNRSAGSSHPPEQRRRHRLRAQPTTGKLHGSR
jgi:hypothetical protein